MSVYEQRIKDLFACWLNKDPSVLESVFSESVVYSECYGPVYHGLSQLKLWFADWNKQGTVLKWDIHAFITSGNQVVCRWYFECEYIKNVDGFDGVSWFVFDDEDKIASVCEYQSTLPHVYPYEPTKGE